jgi:hypothetical protein
MDKFSYISNADVAAIDNIYQQYLADTESVDFGWQKFFEGFEMGQQKFNGKSSSTSGVEVSEDIIKEINVLNLIKGYRTRGHLFTKTNPVRERRKYSPNLNIETFGLKPIKWNIQNQHIPEIKVLDQSIHLNDLNDAVILEVSESEQEHNESHTRKNAFWNVAANVALITLSVGVLYLNSIAIKSVFTSKAKSEASSLVVIKNNEVKPVEKEESVMMVIGGKVVTIDENGIQSKNSKDSSVKKESLDDIRNEIAHSKGKYFVVGGSYITEAAAKMECQKWSKLNYKSTFIKVKGSSLIKIVLKRFVSGKDASNFAISVKTLPTNTISFQELNIAK